MDIISNLRAFSNLIDVRERYIVPVYQRDYSWGEDQRKELCVDLLSAYEREQGYFLGTIVVNSENKSTTGSYEIVDGQQRICTLVTLFCAIRNVCHDYIHDQSKYSPYKIDNTDSNNITLATRIVSEVSSQIEERGKYFLRLNDKDHSFFHSKVLVRETPTFTANINRSDNRTVKAKKEFYKFILDEFIDEYTSLDKLDEFVNFCRKKLLLLCIEVKNDSDAYTLFESLNDRGLDLSIADLVKNRLILQCSNDTEKQQTIDEWERMISFLDVSRYNVPDYLRFYWNAFHEKNCTKKTLYKLIKAKLTDPSVNHLSILSEWTEYAEHFAKITNKDKLFKTYHIRGPRRVDLDYVYAELNELGYSVYLPLFLVIIKEQEAYLEKVAPICMNFLFRLITIGSLSAGTAEIRFREAIDKVEAGRPVNEVIDVFSNEPECNDVKFKERIITREFSNHDHSKYFLKSIHHHYSPSIAITADSELEHILPKNKQAVDWTGFNNGTASREFWINNIGNHTILEKTINAGIGDEGYSVKAVKYNGTHIPMSKKLHEDYTSGIVKDWTTIEIRKRAEKFADDALIVWKIPAPLGQTISGASNETRQI